MAQGIMHKKLGTLKATACATVQRVSAATPTVGAIATAANIWLHAMGGAIYINGATMATSADASGEVHPGAPQLIPIEFDVWVLEKDSGAKYAVWWTQ